jgi:hypothetical protein
LVMRASPKSSDLDPLPSWLLRRLITKLLPVITVIVNRCLDDGMPLPYKQSIICPHLKKGMPDKNALSSYRPVSNLSFL